MTGRNDNDNVSIVDFKASRGFLGFELRHNPKEDFLKLSTYQSNKLMNWLRIDEKKNQKKLKFKSSSEKKGRF